jgi:hypothetical protein
MFSTCRIRKMPWKLATAVALLGLAGWAGAVPLATAPGAHKATGPAVQTRSAEQPPSVHSATQASVVAGPAMAATPTADGRGFWVVWANGAVTTDGDAHWYGDMSTHHLNKPIVGIAGTSDGGGYWLLGGDGGVFEFGDAHFYGSTGNIRLNSPALQMVASHDARGYDFVAGDGGIFQFGDAPFYGSTGAIHLNQPVVGMAANPLGGGYWLVASDGGIFEFGNARFHGSTGGTHLNAPVVGMAPSANGGGYWLVARDGGIFSFGNASFHGSGVGQTGGAPAVGVVATRDGGGYWIVLADGKVLSKGDAPAMSGPSSAASPPQPNGNYAFEVTNGSGVPIRWNPCDGVPYAVVTAGAPAGWQTDVANAVSQVQRATGVYPRLVGEYGSASQVPGSAKLVISWVPALSSGDLVGLTTYWYINTGGYTPEIVKAQVQVLTGLYGGAGTHGELPVLLHELGHAFGLAHTPNAAEVMNPIDQGLANYQLGDLNGLYRVGASRGCAGFYQ